MHLLWIDVKSVKGREEEKDDEMKGRPFGHLVENEEGKSQSVRTVQSWRTAWVRASQKRREKYREQEKIVTDTQWERE